VQTNSRITNDTLVTVFQGQGSDRPATAISLQTDGPDPWIDIPRVNILLLGSDAGVGRDGTRTDSMIVASIDTHSGNTVLFGLPRNLQNVPIPADSPLHAAYPSGYYCPWRTGNECMLNSIWYDIATNYQGKVKDAGTVGRTTLREAISGILDLRIDYTAVVDLAGFQQLVDAMGGVDINVKLPDNAAVYGWPGIPIGAHPDAATGYPIEVPAKSDTAQWILPGLQHLNGYQALWYARSRVLDSDFGRMARQRCVVGALVHQASPATMLTKYQGIAQAAKDNVYTDVSVAELPAMVTLIERVQQAHITSLPFTESNVNTVNPNFSKMRAMVQAALAASTRAASTSAASTSTSSPSSPTSGSTRTRTPSPSTTTGSAATPVDLAEAC